MGDDGKNTRERVLVKGEGEANSEAEATVPPKKKKKSGSSDSSSFCQSIFWEDRDQEEDNHQKEDHIGKKSHWTRRRRQTRRRLQQKRKAESRRRSTLPFLQQEHLPLQQNHRRSYRKFLERMFQLFKKDLLQQFKMKQSIICCVRYWWNFYYMSKQLKRDQSCHWLGAY